MADELQLAMRVATVGLNLAVAVAVGAASASSALACSASPWAARQCGRLRIACVAGLTTAMFASASLLLFAAAGMAEVPVARAGKAVW